MGLILKEMKTEALLLQEKGLIAKNVFFIMKILQVKKLRDIY